MGKRKYDNKEEDSSKKSKHDESTIAAENAEEQPQNEPKPKKVEKPPSRFSFDVKQFRKEIVGKQGQTMGKLSGSFRVFCL